MAAKPDEITSPTRHVAWNRELPMICPVCDSKLVHEFNDGGRKIITMEGAIWVVTNYYRCQNKSCNMNKAFPATHELALERKKFGLDVWTRVIQHRFKHKLNYTQIEMVMEDTCGVKIARGTIRAICEFFEVTGKLQVDLETRRLVKSEGKIVLSLDGAQPKKGRPAFWAFTDRITGRILLTRYLEKAPASIIKKLLAWIEKTYEVPIVAVISDKQRNIVNAIREYNPTIKHAYCQYHFLDHIREVIESKDSHLLTSLRSKVSAFSIVTSRPVGDPGKPATNSPVSVFFKPIAEELLCCVATRGDRFRIFPGMEAHANLIHLLARLKQIDTDGLVIRVKNSLISLIGAIDKLTLQYQPLVGELMPLIMDFNNLRLILAHRKWNGKKVKKKVVAWSYMLKSRLKRRGENHDPSTIKWKQLGYNSCLVEAWQEWVRLVASYSHGLYIPYDDTLLDFTNNAQESIFGKTKHYFRSIYGRKDIQEPFEIHADAFIRLFDMEYEPQKINEILLAVETAEINSGLNDLHARYATTKRKWRTREDDTGNFHRFLGNLDVVRGRN